MQVQMKCLCSGGDGGITILQLHRCSCRSEEYFNNHLINCPTSDTLMLILTIGHWTLDPLIASIGHMCEFSYPSTGIKGQIVPHGQTTCCNRFLSFSPNGKLCLVSPSLQMARVTLALLSALLALAVAQGPVGELNESIRTNQSIVTPLT